MKKEIIMSIVIVIVIIIADIITGRITKNMVIEMTNKLEGLKEIINKEESNEKEISNKIRDIKNTWEDENKTLSYYIEHDELEKVETELNSLIGLSKDRDIEEELATIQRAEFILEHISEKYKLSLNNFF
ncbi:MAG: DUF4363 family protein [Clostridia bacterium]|nr:DUF4363 family protein [Clostridia bacterium]